MDHSIPHPSSRPETIQAVNDKYFADFQFRNLTVLEVNEI